MVLAIGLLMFAGCGLDEEQRACLDPEALHARCAENGTLSRPGRAPEECGYDCDGDGASTAVDCDDTNRNVYPGATEGCGLADKNCDGTPPRCS